MKLIQSLFIALLWLVAGQVHATHNYQDWWWNPSQSGMGLNVGQQDATVFVAWFNYGDDTKASFLTMGGVLNGNTLTGTLYRGTGPAPGPNYNPAQVKQTAVGTASLTFNSNTDATLSYSYDNKSGSIALQRFSFANMNLNQTWEAIDSRTVTGCETASDNGSFTGTNLIKGSQESGNKFNLAISKLDGSDLCVASLTAQPAGSRLTAQGSATCQQNSASANVVVDDFSVQSDYLNFSYTFEVLSGSSKSCVQKGRMAGVVRNDTANSFDLKTARQNRLLKGFSKTFNITGDCLGTFSISDSPAVKTVWNGQSVYAVGTTEIVNNPNCSLGTSGTQTSITYYDLNFVELAKTHSDGSFSEFVKTSQPTSVKVGDTGTLGTWNHWNSTSKSQFYERDVHSYVVEPDSATSVIVNVIDRTYDSNNAFRITSQIRYRLSASGEFDLSNVTIDFANNGGRLVFK